MEIIRREILKEKPEAPLGFGVYFTDYMFTMRYTEGIGWHDAKIEPNVPKAFDLAAAVFHYGQGIFEGMKAFRTSDGRIALFRPDRNLARMQKSAKRLAMPAFPEDVVWEGLKTLISLDRDWIPKEKGTALYIRPVMVATRPMLGVHASTEYLFFILLSPVGSYYAGGLAPTRLRAETVYARVPLEGTGEAKCLGNYAASLLAGELAQADGFDQVLWLDAKERKYVEEAGAMNVFFCIGGKVVTPALVGSILHGVTRESCIALLKAWGVPVEERRISMEEVISCVKDGTLSEAFGTGTAAVVSPIGEISYKGVSYQMGTGEMGKTASRLYEAITSMQRGECPAPAGWLKYLDEI